LALIYPVASWTDKERNLFLGLSSDSDPKFLGVISGLPLETLLSNFKSVALTVFELLAFIAQKFRGSRDPSHDPFWINFRGHVRTVPGKTYVKFEVRSFNRF